MIDAGARAPISDEHEARELLEQALRSAVRRQMISDVPLGAFLSGGIDSSVLVAMMQMEGGDPVRTFTVALSDEGRNEAPQAAEVARFLGTDHAELEVTAREARDLIPLLPDLYSEPFADSSQIPTHLICRAARAHVTVAISGDGGDELFGGYDRYFWWPGLWARAAWVPHPVRRILGRAIKAVPAGTWDGLASLAPRAARLTQVGHKAHKVALRFGEPRDLDDLYRSLVSEWSGHTIVRGMDRQPASILDDPLPSALGDDPVGRMMAHDMRMYLPDDILCKVDRAAMGVSLETRAPFLDPQVVALAARLPTRMKVRDGQGKRVLREVLYRHVPRELVERPKAGFEIPIGSWLRGPLRDWAETLLSPSALAAGDLMDPRPVRAAWEEHLSGRREWPARLWSVLMLQAWRQRWS